MTKFRHSLEVRDGVEELKLEGVLDEDSELEPIGERLVESEVVVDLGEVERVNAGGAQGWWKFVEACELRGAALRVSRCSAAMAAQLNTKGASRVEVERLALPYFCPECDESRTLWVDTSDLGTAPFESPVKRCETCDLVMQFDDTPSYFQFLGSGNDEPSAKSAAASGSEFSSTELSAEQSVELSAGELRAESESESSPLMWVIVAAIVLLIVVGEYLLAG